MMQIPIQKVKNGKLSISVGNMNKFTSIEFIKVPVEKLAQP